MSVGRFWRIAPAGCRRLLSRGISSFSSFRMRVSQRRHVSAWRHKRASPGTAAFCRSASPCRNQRLLAARLVVIGLAVAGFAAGRLVAPGFFVSGFFVARLVFARLVPRLGVPRLVLPRLAVRPRRPLLTLARRRTLLRPRARPAGLRASARCGYCLPCRDGGGYRQSCRRRARKSRTRWWCP